MHAKVKVFTLASVALLSCRAILGIEDIEEGNADGGAGTPDAATDSVGTDSPTTDAGADTGVDAGCSVLTGSECGKCCRDSDQQGNKELETKLAPCLCDGGCGTGKCSDSPVIQPAGCNAAD